jgi:hypothetical protein
VIFAADKHVTLVYSARMIAPGRAVYAEGEHGQRKTAILVLRSSGLTWICPYCEQGVIEQKGVIRDECKVCKRKVVKRKSRHPKTVILPNVSSE